MRRFSSLTLLLLTIGVAVFTQEQQPPPTELPGQAQSEHEQLEEEYMRSRAENGESHASGARPDLGPVVLGNPTTAVVALRVGLYATTFTATGAVATEFASLHHPSVQLTNTDGDVKVIDKSTGKEITIMSAGSLIEVEHDGTAFLVAHDGLHLGSFEGPVFFRPTSGTSVAGTITDVSISERTGASRRAAIVRITFTNPAAIAEVRGWEGIRRVIGQTSSPSNGLRACNTNPALPPTALPANFVLNNPSSLDQTRNPDGSVSLVTVHGGGWGHNLGMSQYGAHGRGKMGHRFIEILKAYYTGTDIGSYPIDIGREPGTAATLRQQFVAPSSAGVLQIRAVDLQGLRVHINELYDLSFDEAQLANGPVSVDVSPYLVTGLNVIQYNPVGRFGSATVNVVVQ